MTDQHATATPHPEDYCHRCNGTNINWFAPSPLWNAVMRGGTIDGPWEWNEIICPLCFAELAESSGVVTPTATWQVRTERPIIPLETVDPSGRIWDDRQSLWIEPAQAGTYAVEQLATFDRLEQNRQNAATRRANRKIAS